MFYVVNLDKGRISILAVVFAGFILVAFATGYRIGKIKSDDAAFKDTPPAHLPGPDSIKKTENETVFTSPRNSASSSLTEEPPMKEVRTEKKVDEEEKPKQKTKKKKKKKKQEESVKLSNTGKN